MTILFFPRHKSWGKNGLSANRKFRTQWNETVDWENIMSPWWTEMKVVLMVGLINNWLNGAKLVIANLWCWCSINRDDYIWCFWCMISYVKQRYFIYWHNGFLRDHRIECQLDDFWRISAWQFKWIEWSSVNLMIKFNRLNDHHRSLIKWNAVLIATPFSRSRSRSKRSINKSPIMNSQCTTLFQQTNKNVCQIISIWKKLCMHWKCSH